MAETDEQHGNQFYIALDGSGEFFRGASGWQVDQITIIAQTIERQGLSAVLKPIPDASHRRNRERSPPNSHCFPGTRRRVLKKIRAWVDTSLFLGHKHPHIFWVYGYAGCGKSAISQAICEHYAEKGRLAASFFFFRGSGRRSRIASFVTTLASQMMAAIPSTAPSLETAVKSDPALLTCDTSLASQFEHLVLRPIDDIKWKRLASALFHGPFLIVIDGLDECEDSKDVSAFIEFLIAFFDSQPHIPIRILITSRVESHIHMLLHSSSQVSLLNLVDHTSDSDISTALDIAISKEVQRRVLTCDPSWPSPNDRKRLVQHVGGSFIFMTTIVKLLFDPDTHDSLTPMDRLPLVLGTSPNFDGLYTAILAPWMNLPHFRPVLGVIALAFEPLTVTQLAEIMKLRKADIVNVLVNLHAIIQVPDDDYSPVTLWHTSLRDFLCSKDRAGTSIYADQIYHLYLAFRCAALSNGKPGAQGSPPRLSYASKYAESHLLKSEGGGGVVGRMNWDSSHIDDSLNKPWFQGNRTALQVAGDEKKWDLVRVLVDVGVNVNATFRSPYSTCFRGVALHSCATDGKDDVALYLLEHGADPNAKDLYGDTPLHNASEGGHVKVVQHLLKLGADPNIRSNAGWTPLHQACFLRGVLKLQAFSWIEAPTQE